MIGKNLGRVRERILLIDDTGRWARAVTPLRFLPSRNAVSE